jgi:hypothetical protein
VARGPPAAAEGAADQFPLTATGAVGAHLKVPPAHLRLDRRVAVLHPLAQAVEPHHLGALGRRQRRVLGCAGRPRQRQVRDQLPRARLGEQAGVASGYHEACRVVRSITAQPQIHRPPGLFMPVMESSHDWRPDSRLLRALVLSPPEPIRRLPQDRPGRLGLGRRRPDDLGGVEREDIRDIGTPHGALALGMLPVAAVGDHRAEGTTSSSRGTDQFQGQLGRGTEGGVLCATCQP